MKLESQMIIIFGATGDLTRRKLIPSLYHLVEKGRLTACTPILCTGRRELSKEQFLEQLSPEKYLSSCDPAVKDELFRRIEYLPFDGDKHEPGDFGRLVGEIECKHGCTANKLIYLALPTGAFGRTAKLISALDTKGGWRRVVFEKPFGKDAASARQLNDRICAVLAEEEIYRVDHYLGKELVQNILALRFGNPVFSAVWNRDVVDHVQITVAESLGVENRAGYYDKSGAVRDMIQNHLLQLLSFVAMEPPADANPDALRDSAAEVLANLRPLTTEDVVLGQYGRGHLAGEDLSGYRDEDGVAADSQTETYCALRIMIDSRRWRGVPFYIRTGKRLRSRYAEIRVVCKQWDGIALFGDEPNVITIRIQPDEGIALGFNVLNPGKEGETVPVLMDFCHHCHFGPNTPEAYEAILYRVMQGDHAIFPRWDWIQASWQWVDGLYQVAAAPVIYQAGTKGPEQADLLLAADGRKWQDMEPVVRLAPVVKRGS